MRLITVIVFVFFFSCKSNSSFADETVQRESSYRNIKSDKLKKTETGTLKDNKNNGNFGERPKK